MGLAVIPVASFAGASIGADISVALPARNASLAALTWSSVAGCLSVTPAVGSLDAP